jgi:hypothetical protein
MVIVLLCSLAAKLTLPVGKAPPKSVSSAGLSPLPVTAKFTLASPLKSPVRVTVDRKGKRRNSAPAFLLMRIRGRNVECGERDNRLIAEVNSCRRLANPDDNLVKSSVVAVKSDEVTSAANGKVPEHRTADRVNAVSDRRE